MKRMGLILENDCEIADVRILKQNQTVISVMTKMGMTQMIRKNAFLFLVADRIVLYSILMLNMFPVVVGMNRMNQNLILVNVCVGYQNVRKTKN